MASGSKDVGFAQISNTIKTYTTPTQFEMDFGFAFTDLMQAAVKPLLLKTRDADGTRCTMHASSCSNDGTEMYIDFLHNGTIYYLLSTDGGQTITAAYNDFLA